jgi:hypothetical protein
VFWVCCSLLHFDLSILLTFRLSCSNAVVFCSILSFLISTNIVSQHIDMSHNGEASTSNATRPTLSSVDPSELSEDQRQTIDKCTAVVQEFRTGKVSKSRASMLLQRSIPHDDTNEDQFLSTYGSYFDMLDNFERYRDGNVDRINNVHQQLADAHNVEQGAADEPPGRAFAVTPAKRQRSVSSDGGLGGDEYTRRTRLDFDALPWNEFEDPSIESSTNLSPALQKTHSLLENFSRDVKRARSSLLNCNRSIPQFPQAEWLNLLSGNAVDLDHVFSNIYTVSHSSNDVIELGKNVELLRGSSTPAKTVKTHGDWVIAWDTLVDATLFVFKHRKQELQTYGKHIQRYFASLPSQFHSRVINYDRAVRIRTAQRRDIELSNISEFADLQIQWISNPSGLGPSQPSESKEPKESKDSKGKGGGGNRRRSAACRRWNENRCPNTAAVCNYLHVCSKCSSPDHVVSNCNSPPPNKK